MKRVLLLAASALVLMAFVPEPADAQGRRFGVRGGVVRGPVYAYPRGYYGYRRGYRPGGGAAIGLGLGAAAVGAAVAARLRTAGSHLFAAVCFRACGVVAFLVGWMEALDQGEQ